MGAGAFAAGRVATEGVWKAAMGRGVRGQRVLFASRSLLLPLVGRHD